MSNEKQLSEVEPRDTLRCMLTGNPCGTDYWAARYPCYCYNCYVWMMTKEDRKDPNESALR